MSLGRLQLVKSRKSRIVSKRNVLCSWLHDAEVVRAIFISPLAGSRAVALRIAGWLAAASRYVLRHTYLGLLQL